MITSRSEINSNIVDFIRFLIADNETDIVNSEFITVQPLKEKRIEFRTFNFENTGDSEERKLGENSEGIIYSSGVIYKGVLSVRVIIDPVTNSEYISKISGGLNNVELRDQFLSEISLLDTTFSNKSFSIPANGVIKQVVETSITFVIKINNEFVLPYFDKVEIDDIILED